MIQKNTRRRSRGDRGNAVTVTGWYVWNHRSRDRATVFTYAILSDTQSCVLVLFKTSERFQQSLMSFLHESVLTDRSDAEKVVEKAELGIVVRMKGREGWSEKGMTLSSEVRKKV